MLRKVSKKVSKKPTLVLPDFARYFFLFAVIAILLLFLYVVAPFLNVLIYSSLIAVFFAPLHKLLLKVLKKHTGVAAFISTFLVLVIFLAPLTLFGMFMAQEAVDAYELMEEKVAVLELDSFSYNGLEDLPYVGETLSVWSEQYGLSEFVAEIDIAKMIQELGNSVTTFIVNQSGNLVKSLSDTVMAMFILLLTVFFFFRDGGEVRAFFKKMSPLPVRYENEIEKKLKDTTRGIVYGSFGTAILQGLAGGIGFVIAGVDNVFFWGTIMAFASLIPYVGAAIIWAPVVIVLLIQGDTFLAGFLTVWGLFVVSAVDNIARPYLIGSSSQMHPLATFLVVLGGILVFGLKGIIFGPLILSLTITIMHIYQLEYKDLLKG